MWRRQVSCSICSLQVEWYALAKCDEASHIHYGYLPTSCSTRTRLLHCVGTLACDFIHQISVRYPYIYIAFMSLSIYYCFSLSSVYFCDLSAKHISFGMIWKCIFMWINIYFATFYYQYIVIYQAHVSCSSVAFSSFHSKGCVLQQQYQFERKKRTE